MTKSALCRQTAFDTGTNIKTATRVVDWFFVLLRDALMKHPRVHLPKVGVFHVATRKKRRILDPNTGEPIRLPKTKSIRFSPSGEWKAELNG